MLIAILLAFSTLGEGLAVNWRPWSVLKISGLPCFAALDPEVGLHGDRHAVAQHSPAEPVDDGDKIDSPSAIGI
jgi:hypothetical protein